MKPGLCRLACAQSTTTGRPLSLTSSLRCISLTIVIVQTLDAKSIGNLEMRTAFTCVEFDLEWLVKEQSEEVKLEVVWKWLTVPGYH